MSSDIMNTKCDNVLLYLFWVKHCSVNFTQYSGQPKAIFKENHIFESPCWLEGFATGGIYQSRVGCHYHTNTKIQKYANTEIHIQILKYIAVIIDTTQAFANLT